MSDSNLKAPPDGKNVESRDFLRYSIRSGQQTPNGVTNFSVETQEGQSFSFHQSTGQGASPTGPGSGRAILSTVVITLGRQEDKQPPSVSPSFVVHQKWVFDGGLRVLVWRTSSSY